MSSSAMLTLTFGVVRALLGVDAAPSRALRSARRPAEAGVSDAPRSLRRHRRQSSSPGVPCHETLGTSVPVWVSGSLSCSSWPSGSRSCHRRPGGPSSARAFATSSRQGLSGIPPWSSRDVTELGGAERGSSPWEGGSTSRLRNGLAGDRRPEVDVTARSEAQDHDPVVLLLRAHDVVLPAHEGGSVPSLPAEPLVEAVSAGGEGTQVEPRPHQRAGLAHHDRAQALTLTVPNGAHTLDLAGPIGAPGHHEQARDDGCVREHDPLLGEHDVPPPESVVPVVAREGFRRGLPAGPGSRPVLPSGFRGGERAEEHVSGVPGSAALPPAPSDSTGRVRACPWSILG